MISESTLLQVLLSLPDGIVIIDQQGKAAFANPAAEALLGRTAGELIGTLFPFPLAPGAARECDLSRPGQELRIAEMRAVETVWEGQPAFLASLRDISERKRKEQLRDEFVGKISHEMRTPLTAIRGAVTLLLNQALGALNAEQRDFLDTVSQDIDRLARLINNILDLSKLEAGKMDLRRQRIGLAELVDQVCRSSQVILGRRRVVRSLEPVPPVYADRSLMVQVLVNLLGNAIKFTAPDGTIGWSLRVDGDRVLLGVRDDGPGIAPEVRGRLFQKFVQIQPQTPGRPSGTGLGLAICREIVELHGGTITVASEPGRGSTFTVTLPAYEPSRECERLFNALKDSLSLGRSEVSVLLIDCSAFRQSPRSRGEGGADELVLECEKLVRENVSRADHVLVVEPLRLAVLAVADLSGAEAMRRRLLGVLGRWAETALGPASARVRMAIATFPHEGDTADQLLTAARAKLLAAGGSPP